MCDNPYKMVLKFRKDGISYHDLSIQYVSLRNKVVNVNRSCHNTNEFSNELTTYKITSYSSIFSCLALACTSGDRPVSVSQFLSLIPNDIQ